MERVFRLFSLKDPIHFAAEVTDALANEQFEGLTITQTADRGEVLLQVRYDKKRHGGAFSQFTSFLATRFAEYYGEHPIDDLVAELLRNEQPGQTPRPHSVAVAESLTGGGLLARLTDPDGAGYVFGGIVPYTAESKADVVGVPRSVLLQHGLVSVEVALHLAEGARTRFRGAPFGASPASCEFGVGLTGWAGPGGGTQRAPVGTVCVAVTDVRGRATTLTVHIAGPRDVVRATATTAAMHILHRHVLFSVQSAAKEL